jgi:hypothetical protein
MIKIVRLVLLSVTVCLAVFATVACGGGGDDDDGNVDDPEATATYPPGFTPQPPELLTPAPPPPIDPNIALQPTGGEDRFPYEISLPDLYTADRTKVAFDFYKYETERRGLISTAQISCNRTVTTGQNDPLAVLREEADLLQDIGTPFTSISSEETSIDGKPSYRWHYAININPMRVFHWVYYVPDATCVWKVRFVVFGTGGVEDYATLFDRIMSETFHVTSSPPETSG